MTVPRRVAAGIVLALGATAISGCSAESATSGSEDAAAPKITFLYSPYADYAPFFLAEEKGYFEEAGLDVELVSKSGSSGETYQQVSTGNITAGGATWGAGLFNATESGASLSVIASVSRVPETGPNPSPLVVSTDSGITNGEDLAGTTIGIPGDGGFGIYSVALALESVGLTLDDVSLTNLSPGDIPAALANGSVQGAWSIEPISTAIINEDIAQELFDISYHAGVELGALVFNAEYVDAHPEAVTDFTAAYLRAAQELEDGGWDDADNQEIIAKYTDLPVETLTAIALTEQDPTGSINWDDVARQEQFFRDRGALEYTGESSIQDAFREDILEAAKDRAAEAE